MITVSTARILLTPRPNDDDDTVVVRNKAHEPNEVSRVRVTTVGGLKVHGRPIWANTLAVGARHLCIWHLDRWRWADSVEVVMYSDDERPCDTCADTWHWPTEEAGMWNDRGQIIDGWTSPGDGQGRLAGPAMPVPEALPSTLNDIFNALLDFAERGLRWQYSAWQDSLYPVDEAGRVAYGWDAEAWLPWLIDARRLCARLGYGLPQVVLNAEAAVREGDWTAVERRRY